MAKERAKDFDAEKFIEEFRESAVPTYHRASKPIEKKPEVPPPEIVQDPRPFDEEDDEMSKYIHLTFDEPELSYIKNFVARKAFTSVVQKGKQVIIRDRHRKRIQTIQQLLGEEPNMATYIDNVLDVHFKQFYPEIMGIYKKCPPKF